MSSTRQPPPIAKIEQRTVVDLLTRGRRIDERSITDYRKLEIETGIIEKANGSAQVRLGKTKVLVGVKIEQGTPFPDAPNEGVLTVNAELVPLASPSFEPGPPDENSIELARIVDRGVRESKAIELGKLCIEPGKKVLVVFVDIYVLDHDGNLIDGSAIAALAALLSARMKAFRIESGNPVFTDEWKPLPIVNLPVAVTLAKINGTLIVDPILEEEQVMDARLTITFDKDDKICAMQKGGLGILTPEEVKRALPIALEKSRENRRKILEATGWIG